MDLLATIKCKSSAIIEAHTDGVKADLAVRILYHSQTLYGQNIHPWSKPGQMKDLIAEKIPILERTFGV